MKPSRPPESLSQSDWQQTPPTVQAYLLNLHQRLVQLQQQIERLRNRLQRTAKTSDKPPSSDSPFQRHASNPSKPTGKRGARQGHPGAGPRLHRPTERQAIYPEPCICGQGVPRLTTPYHTHQVMELPSTLMHVTHWVLHEGKCAGCGKWLEARLPKARQSGYGPRLTALTGELSAMHRTSRRGVQDFCRSVLGISISLGAIQRLIDRTSLAIVPHDAAIARLARKAPVGYVDETPWYCGHALQWLWSMVTDTVALYRIHAKRSQAAFESLIKDWRGTLVSDGYGVYQAWGNARQSCLAHLVRRARELSQRPQADLAACGKVALKELQRLCQMAHAPPSGGQWQAWYARLCRLVQRYESRPDDAGRLVRHLRREAGSLWVFLNEPGVEPTNNRAERALRFGVLWRKGSLGTASAKGNAWVQRCLSLRQTCRQPGQSSFSVLVDALGAFMNGRQPDLSWLR